MSSTVIHTTDAPEAIGPYVQGRVCGPFLYTSGCVAIDPHNKDNKPEDVKDQMRMILKNMDAIITAGGFSKTDVIKTTLFLLDMNDFAECNKIYAEYFGEHKPCRTCVQAAKLPAGFKCEIDAVCYKA